MLALGTLDILKLAKAHGDAFRGLGDVDDIGGIGTGFDSARDEGVGSFACGMEAEHSGAKLLEGAKSWP